MRRSAVGGAPGKLVYRQRRVDCHRCGIRIERIEFADAKALADEFTNRHACPQFGNPSSRERRSGGTGGIGGAGSGSDGNGPVGGGSDGTGLGIGCGPGQGSGGFGRSG